MRKSLSEAIDIYNNEKSLLISLLKSPEKSYNFADQVIKLSKSRLLTHQRILQIKNGFLFYYKRVPKGWKSNYFDLLKEAPKIAVRLSEILIAYLGNDQSNDSKYIYMQLNARKVLLLKSGPNFIENISILENEEKASRELFKEFKPSKKNLKDLPLVFSIKLKYGDNGILDLLNEKIKLAKSPPIIKSEIAISPLKEEHKKQAVSPQKKSLEHKGTGMDTILHEYLNTNDKEEMLKQLRASNINDSSSSSFPLQEQEKYSLAHEDSINKTFEAISIIEEKKTQNNMKNSIFPSFHEAFQQKSEILTKDQSIRDYENEFFCILSNETMDNHLKSQEMSKLLGDYSLFTREIVASLFECLPKGDYPYDFRWTNSRKDLEIDILISDSMQMTLQYIAKKSTKDDFSQEFSFLKTLYHEYCLVLTGICSFYMDFKNNSNNIPKFKSPLPCLITYQGNRVLILTKNPFYTAEEYKIHGFSEGQQNQRISAKFLEDFKRITNLLRLDAQQTYMSLSLSQELIVFQRDFCYYIVNPQGISPKDAFSSKKRFNYLRTEALLMEGHTDFFYQEQQEKVLELLLNLQEIPLAEHHFSDLLHRNGLKICHAGFLLASTIVKKTPYLKNILILEIISRSCKQMMRNLLLQSDSQGELSGLALDFINLVNGKEEDSNEFWTELLPANTFRHFSIDFHENIDKKTVDPRILIKKIASQCGLRIVLDGEDERSDEKLLKTEDFQGFFMKIQVFSLKNTSFLCYLHAQASLSEENIESCFQANLSLYSLYKSIEDSQRTIDFGLNLCELYHKTLNYSQAQASLTKLFDYFKGQPALELKGNYLLFRNKLETEPEKSLEFFVILLEKLDYLQGAFSPLHIFCYKDLALYYKGKGRVQDSVFLLKNAIICAGKLFYQEHEIIANLYAEIAEAYILLKTYEDALFYLQKTWEISKLPGVGLKIAKLLLTMNRILEAKELFLMLLERNARNYHGNTGENADNPLQKLEIMINLAHICLILNEKAEAEQFLKECLQFYGDLPLNYEANVVSLVFFLTIRRLSQSQRRLIWVISRSLQDYGSRNSKGFIEYTKKYWNLLDFMKIFFDELVFICEKHEYNNDSEYWRLYLKNIEVKDPHNMLQSLECLCSLMKIVGTEVFLEELMR